MKSFFCQSGNVRIEEIGAQRTEFEPPPRSPAELRSEIARRRARSRAIREQNRNEQGKM
jgi:hypothetical protein